MSGSQRMLIFGGLALAAFGMLYGLHYALFVEHQALDRMGGSLAQAFMAVGNENVSQAHLALTAYGSTKYDYVRQVDAHSHWIGLSMLLIVLGAFFGQVSFGERVRRLLAIALLTGSIVFPFAVLLQTTGGVRMLGSVLAVAGSGLVTLALAGVAVGFLRQRA